jgi:thiol-disulfide isomerase/thioredoxin
LIGHSREIIFSYDDREIALILSPGDQAELYLSMETFQSLNGPIKGRFKGVHQQAVTLMLNFQPKLDDWVGAASSAFSADKSMSESDYRAMRMQEMTGQLQELERIISDDKIDNQEFKYWATAKIRYAAANDLCLFPFLGKVNTTIHEADPYFDFIGNFSPENVFVATLQSYTNYAKTLISDLNIIGNIAEKHRHSRDSLKSNGSTLPLKFELLSKTLQGRERELALTNLFLKAQMIPPAYLDSLNRYLPLAEIQKMQAKEISHQVPLTDLLNSFPLREEEKQPLMELYREATGKVIYHDFWFANCGPCMRELPYYNELIDKAGADVEFVFYGVYMQETEWKDTIAKYGLKGKHHLLSKNQMAFFERYFKLNGFPHHQILNSKGIIVPEKLPGVYPEQFGGILQLLEKAKGE